LGKKKKKKKIAAGRVSLLSRFHKTLVLPKVCCVRSNNAPYWLASTYLPLLLLFTLLRNVSSCTSITHVCFIVRKNVQGAGVAQSVQRLGYGLDDRCSIHGRGNYETFSLCHRFQTGSDIHPTSHPMGTGCSYPVDKSAGA